MKYSAVLFSVFLILTFACEQTTSKANRDLISTDHHFAEQSTERDSVFKMKKSLCPRLSDIYQRTRQDRPSLTSTLSIHNINETDIIYISRIDYYNTEGKLVRKYINSTIFLNTFETLEYVVDEEDDTGGSGANFFIEWCGDNKLNPLFQAVMIGGLGNKSFPFTTNGVEVH